MVATYSCVETSSRLNLKVQLLRVCQSVCSQCVTQASICQLVTMGSGNTSSAMCSPFQSASIIELY